MPTGIDFVANANATAFGFAAFHPNNLHPNKMEFRFETDRQPS